MRREIWHDGQLLTVEDDGQPEPTPPPVRYSKLALRRALRARGLEEYFESALDSNVQTRRDWDDAAELWSTDPIMSQAVPAFAAALQLQPTDVAAILSEAAV